jgi:lipoprotein-anchoring transpeptidase ErfK/SrfK
MGRFASRFALAVAAVVPLIASPTVPPKAVRIPVVSHGAAAFQGQGAVKEIVRIPLPLPRPEPEKKRFMVVRLESSLPITSKPGGGAVIGTFPSVSKFGTQMVTWVQDRSKSGKYGKITVPYTMYPRPGWIKIKGLKKSYVKYSVEADLSKRRLRLLRYGKPVMTVPTTTGMPSRPTPPGRYTVVDRWTSSPSGSLGAFVFALSGLQINYPGAESGLFIMAIHGTNSPSTLGTSASNGCLRVGSKPLNRMIPALRLGTPVIIRP